MVTLDYPPQRALGCHEIKYAIGARADKAILTLGFIK